MASPRFVRTHQAAERRFLCYENRTLPGGLYHRHEAYFYGNTLLETVSENLDAGGAHLHVKVGVRPGISGTVPAVQRLGALSCHHTDQLPEPVKSLCETEPFPQHPLVPGIIRWNV